jgi:hypothetical protein
MSRINRKHSRAIERRRRNHGPELLSQAADNELKLKAGQLAEGLSKATIDNGSVAAASLLVTLAECAVYQDNPAAFERAFSFIDRWEKEPQVVALDSSPQIGGPAPQLRLTDGSATAGAEAMPEAEADAPEAGVSRPDGEAPGASSTPPTGTSSMSGNGAGPQGSEILEGEYEMVSGTSDKTAG